MKLLVRGFSSALLAIAMSAAAHGDWPPKHGGLMNEGGETSFELVARGRQVVLYVEDHGKPLEANGARGTLVITRMGETWSSEITSMGGNRLKSVLARKIQRGDRLSATIVMGDGSIVAPRFVVR